MKRSRLRIAPGVLCLALMTASSASAQVLGTFNWQMQPFCHRVVLTLTGVAGTFTLDGFEDQCGASGKGSAIGVGTFTSTGDLTLNFTIVTAPAGRPVHVSAVVSTGSGHGTWSDSVGNTGTFVMGGAVPGLPARTLLTSGLAPGSITASELAADSVGASEIAASAVGTLELAESAVRSRHLAAIALRSSSNIGIAPGAVGQATASCLGGEEVISGGNTSQTDVVLLASRRQANGWVVIGRNDSSAVRTITAQAYCLQ
jgi:hypothetical protein